MRRDLISITVQLEPEILAAFKSLAAERETSLSALARLACKNMLEAEDKLPKKRRKIAVARKTVAAHGLLKSKEPESSAGKSVEELESLPRQEPKP